VVPVGSALGGSPQQSMRGLDWVGAGVGAGVEVVQLPAGRHSNGRQLVALIRLAAVGWANG
jgi:hypothetical protein